MEYHVSKKGNDNFKGSAEKPFLTISKAAAIADEGDRIIVHAGVYRECVVPQNGARNDSSRIIYEAAENEKVIIKGSERITNWENEHDSLWKAEISNKLFGDYNPYSEIIDGDWLMRPLDNPIHTGQVYINGKALTEVSSIELLNDFTWYAQVQDDITTVYANFANYNPNEETAEINVRKSCFCPDKTGVNYITVRGFEFAQAATQWSPPTAEQMGMLSVNWSKGWIIENNIFYDARCSAICIGKEKSTGHNMYNRYHRKAGYQTQLETVFAGRRIGWSKETIGSHIIRNNTIYDCGQNAIVGHMGGAFSEIYGNHIYNIGTKHEFFGYEIAGIKLHAAIDTYIHHNNIHDCTLGTWLDWEAQGVRVSQNLYYDNDVDIWFEVTHGPYLVDNNIFASKRNLKNAAQGGAYIHNLFCGSIKRYDVTDRSTPYHLNHSTDFMGTAVVYGGDDRYYQNIFIGGEEDDNVHWQFGTEMYNGFTVSMEEYISKVLENGKGDIETYKNVRQPAYINKNVYLNGAECFDREKEFFKADYKTNLTVKKENGDVYLEIDVPDVDFLIGTEIIETKELVIPRISESPYESPDGKNIVFDTDYMGNTRSENPKPGPFEKLSSGRQKIMVYSENKNI